MATILRFMGRGQADGDWTVSERTKLREMSAALTGDRTGANLVFGMTEDGDPWVVATDDNEEVVLHIARIGGRIIIHRMFDGLVREASDVFTAAALIQQRPPARVGKVQPILADVLPTDAPFSLIAGAALQDTPADAAPVQAETAPRFEPIHSERHASLAGLRGDDLPIAALEDAPLHVFAEPAQPHAPLQPTAEIIQIETYLAAAAGVTAASAPLPTFAAPQPAAAATSVDAPVQTDGEIDPNQEPQVGPSNPGAEGGGGGDKGFEAQTYVTGGDGADVIVMGERVVAFGGDGADTFIVGTQKNAGASRNGGVILDYNERQGDRLVFANDANPPQIVSIEGAELPSGDLSTSFVGAAIGGRRIGFDVDGDGLADIHIVFGGDSQITAVFNDVAANLGESGRTAAAPAVDGDFAMGIAAVIAISPAELFI